MTHVTCRLTAKNRDQLRNPTLGKRVRATFAFLPDPNFDLTLNPNHNTNDVLNNPATIFKH